MPTSHEQQVANLVYFLQQRWQPHVEAVTAQTEIRVAPLYDRIAFLETSLWLRLGAALEFFPNDLARRVVKEHLPILKNTYHAVVERGHDRMFQDDTRKVLEGIPFGERFLGPSEPGSFGTSAQSVFRDFLLLSNEFTRDPEARTVIQAVNFGSVNEWDELMRTIRAPLERLLPESEAEKKATEPVRQRFSWGLIKIVEYMEAYQDLVDDLDTYPSLPAHLRSNLYQLQEWRLNFKGEEVRRRFDLLSEGLIFYLLQQEGVGASVTERARELTQNLQDKIRILITHWGAPPLSMTAGTAR